MKSNKKLYGNIAFGSFVAAFVIGAIMLASLLPAYNCISEGDFESNYTNCPALDRAESIVNIGMAGFSLSTLVFILSFGMFIYYHLKREE